MHALLSDIDTYPSRNAGAGDMIGIRGSVTIASRMTEKSVYRILKTDLLWCVATASSIADVVLDACTNSNVEEPLPESKPGDSWNRKRF